MIIAVDFDGTLCEDCYPEIGRPVAGAIDAMIELKKKNNYLIINTCREGKLLTNALNWLLEHGIPFDRVNDNVLDNVLRYGFNARKVYAHVYIDNNNLGGLPPWEKIPKMIEKTEQEWMK